jgi:acyl-[acyl-carrier-protein]-phospholipid O-acyltransferase / long-chain-fatty-acid--[acyl-carrier-protein] ligase
VSLLDAAMLVSVLPRSASFAVNTDIAEVRWIKPFLRFANTFKLDPTKPLAARSLVNTVRSGQTIVVFPEGRITTTGSLMKVYDGAGMTADKTNAWIVPVQINGAERTKLFSYLRPTQIKKAWRPKISITFLPPTKLAVDPTLKGRARRRAAGAALQDILIETRVRCANTNRTIFEAFADSAKTKSHSKVAIQDPLGTKLSMKKLMRSAQVLGPKLQPYAGVGDAIGVMLPNSAGVAVVMTAVMSIGRVPAMINFSSGATSIRATCTAAKVQAVLTSRAFIEKGRLQPLVDELGKDLEIVYLDDIRASISTGDKIRGVLAGMRPHEQRKPDDRAVILFTSGSEGTPKGVVLSHRNILTNIAQGLSRMDLNTEDRVFNALPVFHSFGLVIGTILPLVEGVPLYMYPTPLHYRIIPELVYDKEATVLFGTDTFLNGYARAAHPYDLRKVRILLAGAEAVKERTRQMYMDKFGVRILEGYGVTETSPGLAMGAPMASKPGTLGRILPLMQTRLEDVPGLPSVQGDMKVGRLHVKGPNVMLGYMRAEKPGVLEPPVDGWYDTGDIVGLDSQGFVRIMGRAKRFAKIGGEMVSLAAVEAMAADLFPAAMSVAAALPDARKGERIVLLTQASDATRDAFIKHTREKSLSELTIPADVLVVPSLPLLGSGKPDFTACTALARERSGRKDAA